MIPKEWEGSDFYEDLGVTRFATQKAIRTAHRKKIKEYHPDVYRRDDHSEQFHRISLAYSVLHDPIKRAEYDSYLFPDAPIPVKEGFWKRFSKKSGARLLWRTALFILVILLFEHQGILNQAPTTFTENGQKFTAVPTQSVNANENQVLELLVGPQGPPGPAGIAGKNGFIGLNGYQGKDGLPGAPGIPGATGATGATGPAGPAGADGAPGANGANGATGPAGPQGPAGPAGPAGAQGPIGPAGPAGASGSGGNVFQQGSVLVGACDNDGVNISLQSQYYSGEFYMKAINVSGIAYACNGEKLTIIINTLSPTGNSQIGDQNYYRLGDAIECDLSLAFTDSTNNANSVSITPSNGNCTNIGGSRTRSTSNAGLAASFTLDQLAALDVSSSASGLGIQIATP